MGEISFDAGKLSEIIRSFNNTALDVARIRSEIEGHISTIRGNWTGSEDQLAGREKDFANILKNLENIKQNIDSIRKFLEEKNTDFSKISY